MSYYRTRASEVTYHPNETEQYRWIRSDNGWIAGVCEGLAPKFGMPVWTLRALWVLLALAGFGFGIVLYFIMAFCLPSESTICEVERKKILGVCLRLSRAFHMEVGLVRVLTVLLAILSLGLTAVAYLILNFIVPENPDPLR